MLIRYPEQFSVFLRLHFDASRLAISVGTHVFVVGLLVADRWHRGSFRSPLAESLVRF